MNIGVSDPSDPALQFLGDVAAHIGLAILMMALVLGFFSPEATPVVELIVLLLFLGDEVCAHA
jgi:hypothetical protein